jgi:two-component system chemotaxis sensor kinase CheA
VLETLRVERSDIQFSEDREVLNLRGEPLVVRDLAREFELPASEQRERCFAVVLGLGDARVGILVDRLEGQQDAVVKPIQGPVATIRGVTGATELGSRGAVLVLDVAALVEKPLRQLEAA